MIKTIIICFTIIFVFLAVQLNGHTDITHRKRRKKKLKTGDLVAVSYDSIRGNLFKIFTGSNWTHIGMIIILKGDTYVLEVARYNDNEHGIILKKWKEWANWNDGRIIGCRPYNGVKEFPIYEFLKYVKIGIEKDVNANLFVFDWLWTLIKIPYNKKSIKKRKWFYCSEFIIGGMQYSGILKKKYDASGYKPWELIYGKLRTNEGYSYGKCSIID